MNITRGWKRFVFVGCNHAELIHEQAEAEFFQFVESFKPHFKVHAGDNYDTSAWRSGAKGSADSAKDIDSDFNVGTAFLRNYKPNLCFVGNHEHRFYEQTENPNAIIKKAAQTCVKEYESLITKELKAELVEYNVLTGWRRMGDAYMGHGYMYNEVAARDHAEMMGGHVMITHTHALHSMPGRCKGAPVGYTCGGLIDKSQAGYALRRRATHRWRMGWAYGEYCDTETKIFLHQARQTTYEPPKAKLA